MTHRNAWLGVIAGLAFFATACSADPAADGANDGQSSGAAAATVTTKDEDSEKTSKSSDGVTSAPITATETGTTPIVTIESDAAGPGPSEPSGAVPTSASVSSEQVCGNTEFVEDAYHFATSGHDFLQICSPSGRDGGVILSYVYESVEMNTVPIKFQSGVNYQLDCEFVSNIPVCLVQAADSSGKSYSGSLYSLTNDGLLEPMAADAQTSSVEMTLTGAPPGDNGEEHLLLTEGWNFFDLGTSAADAPVGYRTTKVESDAVTITGCTAAYTGGYPELPTGLANGPCDSSAAVINN